MCFSKWFLLFVTLHFFTSTIPIFSVTEEHSETATKFLEYAKKPEVFDWMVKIRRKIHENPELGYEEFKTSEFIRSKLDELGIRYEHPVAITGVIGYIGTGQAPFVALRADIDALPIQELVEWEHKSKVPGKMHACGHDAHVTMLLGAAKILKLHEQDILGTIVLVFQPAEEGGGGAKRIVESKVLENVSAIFGIHLMTHSLGLGHVSSKAGTILAATGAFEAVITGKGGHSGFPQHSIDPILAASNVVISLQSLVSQEADPLDPQVVSVAKFKGGDGYHVIPDSVTIGGAIRALSKETFINLRQRVQQVIKGQASVHRCNATINFFDDENQPFLPPTVNNLELHEHFKDIAINLLGTNRVHDMEPLMGSEDFAFYQESIPGYFFLLGMQSENGETLKSLHSPYFTVNEDVLPYGAALHASLSTSYLIKCQKERTLVEGEKQHDEL